MKTFVSQILNVLLFSCPTMPDAQLHEEKKRNTNEHIFTYLAHCIIVVLHGIQILL